MPGAERRVGVVDIGTNSTRLLVADVERDRVEELERRTRVTRLGRGVDLSGQLSSEAIEGVCETVGEYVETYRQLGAERVFAIATSAVRDASNGGAFIAELRERFALSARVLDGEEEARLTYRGAIATRQPADHALVIDIGGGSTELVVGANGAVDFHTSTQVGVVRHSERHLHGDPPAADELQALAEDARAAIDAAVPADVRARPAGGVGVGGTATQLASVDLGLAVHDRERVEGHAMTRERLEQLRDRLAALPLEQRREVRGLDPARAPTIVAGVVILIEAVGAFALDGVEVSERDILWGVALDSPVQT
jgi:exopolyphosphatase / guanosine-5'-triphosphate,3'-diphosphate pyrophosphatase